ncbi:hypothetical protein F5141DRAFT_1213042 [Pisolithus sp. B1]|nr:hypothetical protein F5141DRAFT_1213042 [Pisolithus sp. B1]
MPSENAKKLDAAVARIWTIYKEWIINSEEMNNMERFESWKSAVKGMADELIAVQPIIAKTDKVPATLIRVSKFVRWSEDIGSEDHPFPVWKTAMKPTDDDIADHPWGVKSGAYLQAKVQLCPVGRSRNASAKAQHLRYVRCEEGRLGLHRPPRPLPAIALHPSPFLLPPPHPATIHLVHDQSYDGTRDPNRRTAIPCLNHLAPEKSIVHQTRVPKLPQGSLAFPPWFQEIKDLAIVIPPSKYSRTPSTATGPSTATAPVDINQGPYADEMHEGPSRATSMVRCSTPPSAPTPQRCSPTPGMVPGLEVISMQLATIVQQQDQMMRCLIALERQVECEQHQSQAVTPGLVDNRVRMMEDDLRCHKGAMGSVICEVETLRLCIYDDDHSLGGHTADFLGAPATAAAAEEATDAEKVGSLDMEEHRGQGKSSKVFKIPKVKKEESASPVVLQISPYIKQESPAPRIPSPEEIDPNLQGFVLNLPTMDPCNLTEDMLQFMQQLSVMVGQQVATAVAAQQQNRPAGAGASVDPTKRGIADLGQFDGSISKFEEWWLKMWAFVAITEFKTHWEDALAVWSRMTGPIAGAYVRARIDSCLTAQRWLTHAELANIRQGNARMEEFLAKFNALRTASRVSDDYAIWMLERAMRPEILQQIYIQGRRQATWKDFEPEVQAMGAAMEAVKLQTSQSGSR